MFLCPSPTPPSSAATLSPSPGSTKFRSPRSARTSGSCEATLHNWLKKADIEDGVSPGVTEKEAAELREAKKRIRLLEQENEILR